jgi:D-3-phosphoglycerate dehydrogenase
LYDEDALYDGLKSGKIRFAGIDVFNKEPAINNKLLDLDNICVSPHLGANTFESQLGIALEAAQQAIEAAKGIAYPHALNLPIDETKIPAFVKPFLEMGQKIGFLASQMNKAPIVSIKVSGRGDIAEYVNSLATFVTVGALADISGDTINYVNADFVARERGIKIETEELPASTVYKNLVTVKLTTDKNVIEISATMFGDDVQRIVDINGFGVDVEPKGNMILFKNTDVPGVIGQVGTLLAAHEVNIADFRLGRNKSGEALAVIIVDSAFNDKTLKELSALNACISVSYARI